MPNNPINKKTSALLVNNVYSLPIVDGTSNQAMITNGAGVASWSTKATSIVVQTVSVAKTDFKACTTILPIDDTIPTSSEGDEVLTLAITPTNVNNKLLIVFTSFVYDPGITSSCALFQDSTAGALSACFFSNIANRYVSGILRYIMTAGTTSSTTFKIRIGPSTAGTIGVNGQAADIYGGTASTLLTITEYIP